MNESFFNDELVVILDEKNKIMGVLNSLESTEHIIDFRLASIIDQRDAWERKLNKSNHLLEKNSLNDSLIILNNYAKNNYISLCAKADNYQEILNNTRKKLKDLNKINDSISAGIKKVEEKERYSQLEYKSYQQEQVEKDPLIVDIHNSIYKAQGYIELNQEPEYLLLDLEKGEN